MGYNQVIMNGEVKLDLTADTVSEDSLLAGITAHNSAGNPITGAVVTVPVDIELSETSENAIQNKAVAKSVKGGETLSGGTGYSINDCVKYPLIGMKVYGKSTQDWIPTSENPAPIVSVVVPTVIVCGKNLIRFGNETRTLNGITATTEANTSTIELSGIPTGTGYFAPFGAKTLTKGTYVFSVSALNSNNILVFVRRSSDNIYLAQIGCGLNRNVFTVEEDTDVFFGCVNYNATNYINETIYLQLEKGAIATDYEPYTSHKLSLPYALNAIPVSSCGNVTIEGQEYIADYVDFEEGKCHRLVDPNKLESTVSIVDNLDLLLETEEVTDISEDEMQAYRQLQTYNGVTNISNDKGAGIEVSYCTNKALSTCVASITSGLQKQIDDLKSAILSLGGNV